MRSIDWRDGRIVAIDQTKLPAGLVELTIASVDELVIAIQRLAIRGAPALGAAGALGAALAVRADPARRERDLALLRGARPTAVNLAWGVDRAMARFGDGPEAVLAEALEVLAECVAGNRVLGRRGADWITGLLDGPISVQTHCNAGGLACVDWGTALGVLRSLHERGRLRHVYVDETRPLLQGARLTAWELARLGVPHTLVADAAGPTVLARGLADAVVVGADRIAANGDVVNKIGTYPLALAAARAGVPFLVAAPESTIDVSIASGDRVEIEVRDGAELLSYAGVRTAPSGTQALNVAFDVTPADLVSAIVTEERLIRPAVGERPA